jgi:RimJ/RimL family protein N-acetyltransferase
MGTDDGWVERWQELQRLQERRGGLIRRRHGTQYRSVLPELEGARVRLRAIETGDMPQLHVWSTDQSEMWLWREEARLVAYDPFLTKLQSALTAGEPHLMVEGKHSGFPIGWVYADQVSNDHCRCRMTVYIIPEARAYGAGAEAGVLFLDYLFGWRGMRKIYIETLAVQTEAIQIATKGGFCQEGMLSQERSLGGQPMDVVRLAMRRDYWQETLADDGVGASVYRLTQVRRLLQTYGMFTPNSDTFQCL